MSPKADLEIFALHSCVRKALQICLILNISLIPLSSGSIYQPV